jgi:hypothetical protein
LLATLNIGSALAILALQFIYGFQIQAKAAANFTTLFAIVIAITRL